MQSVTFIGGLPIVGLPAVAHLMSELECKIQIGILHHAEAVGEAKHTMRLIQILSVVTFALGVVIVGAGMYLAVNESPGSADKLIGCFHHLGL